MTVTDPMVREEQVRDLLAAGADWAQSAVDAWTQADVCFITTTAPEFGFAASETASGPIVVDGRGTLRGGASVHGDRYVGVGMGPLAEAPERLGALRP